MKFIAFLLFVVLFFQINSAQKNQTRPAASLVADANGINDEEKEFAEAVALTDASERIAALQKFVDNFLKSRKKSRNIDLLVRARAYLGDEKLRSDDQANAVALYKLAVADVPPAVSDKLFNEVLIKIPNGLAAIKEKAAAFEIARLIETKISGSSEQKTALAKFYLDAENSEEAIRLANQVIQAKPEMSAAYQILGNAYRLNFDVAGASNVLTKALRLDESSVAAKQQLADLKRALGRTPQALALYREILQKNEMDSAARTGLILALFDANERAQAETEMKAALAQNPKNAPLLVGAAYWYAVKGEAAKAIELANKTLAVDSQNVWAHIALAHGLMLQKRPLEAEKTLLAARNKGANLATLEYELATARFQADLFREAAEDLSKNFKIQNGLIETKLGGREAVEERNFIDLLAAERQANIFQPAAANKSADAEKMKNFLDFYQQLQTETDEAKLAAKIEEFINGDDKMKTQRQQFAESVLADKSNTSPKSLPSAATNIAKKSTTPTKNIKTVETKTAKNNRNEVAKAEVKPKEIVAKAELIKKSKSDEKSAAKTESKKFSSCKLSISRENVVIGTAGGNFGILLKFEGAVELPEIKTVSSSPADIEVVYDSEVASLANRAFYLIKSNSRKTGVFTVLFETSCGKKEISVTVL